MTRGAIPLFAIMLAGCTQPAHVARGGIVSTNPCADAILIELVEPHRIAAISHYSHNPAASSIAADVARRFPSTAGTAEEVIALDPELVLTSSFTPLATRAAYERAGLKTLVMNSPTTVEASKAQITEVAAALRAEGNGRALNARIDVALVAATVPRDRVASQPSALLYIAGDLVNGSGTLLDELLRKADFRNVAADYGLASTGNLPIETIAARPPRVIMTPDDASRTAALRRRVLAHTGAATTEAHFPRNLVNCGGPTIIPALGTLARIRRSLS